MLKPRGTKSLSPLRSNGKTDWVPCFHTSCKDPVFRVALIKTVRDPVAWKMCILADNLLKGAALNGLQIAEAIYG
jgi:aspartate-semialdehyde dehydrogenase